MKKGVVFIVDRVEEELLVLTDREGREIAIPRDLLPGAREGEVLTVRFNREPQETAKRRKIISRLQDRLRGKRRKKL